MRSGLLYQLNHLISANERLVELYRSIYYFLPVKETDLLINILSLLEKREQLEQKLKKCAFHVRNSVDDKQVTNSHLFHFMSPLLNLELLARQKFKGTRQNWIYLEEKKYLKKYFECLYKDNLSDTVFELLLKYKRRKNPVF